ncbi:hypothetical protein Rrhod_2582 [Rhodococcus rhodnii LMG 5362]|uniref:Uncharacterized protein n=1 Tax=Rhodococcus rhodnii LMG 5362 TaxID=1273125 RepID=R7WL92_9NOCA|nr:hypothetical protein Rrhod_2582 [Rhodococcus rhodnii LMG 5362]
MSTILFDQLVPFLGPDAAAYWATVFAIRPI